MDEFIPIIAIVSLFIVLPGMIFHYITLWRKQKTLMRVSYTHLTLPTIYSV